MKRKKVSNWLSVICLIMSIVCFLNFAEANIILKIAAANPAGQIRKVPVKSYLPKDIKAEDVVNKGEFEIGYDYEKALYYVSREIELGPKESVILEVELKDVWYIEEEKLESLNKEVEEMMKFLEGTEYYNSGEVLRQSVEKRLNGIREVQRQEELNVQKRIARHEKNREILKSIKEDMAILGQLVEGLKAEKKD